MVPQSTPIGPLYTESGLLDITTITTKKQNKPWKATTQTTQQHDNESNE